MKLNKPWQDLFILDVLTIPASFTDVVVRLTCSGALSHATHALVQL